MKPGGRHAPSTIDKMRRTRQTRSELAKLEVHGKAGVTNHKRFVEERMNIQASVIKTGLELELQLLEELKLVSSEDDGREDI